MRIKLILASIVLTATIILLPKAASTEETTKSNPFQRDWGEEEKPQNKPDSDSQTTGSRNPRSCDYRNTTEIKALRPGDTIDTQKSHPGFLFYLQGQPSTESQPIKIRYSIVDTQSDRTVIYTNFEVQKSDTFIALSLPEEISGLEGGREYILTIGVICQEKRPNKDRIDIFRVRKLNESTQTTWLDALYQAFNSGDRASFQGLLEKENLLFDSKVFSSQTVAIAPEDKQKELDP